MDAPAPFIVGVPRSGTTLLRLMLDAHPDLAIPPETHFLPRLIKMSQERDAGAADILEVITNHPRWPDFGLDPQALRARIERIEPFDVGDAVRAFYRLYAERQGKPRWGDKSPNYVMRMRRINRVLPEARFIHLIRDGRDVVLSLTERTWGPGEVAEAAERWAQDIRKARRQLRRPLNPIWWKRIPKCIEVRYEDLVTDPEPHLRRVCEFIELPWDDDMLAFHERAGERMREVIRDFKSRRGHQFTAEERHVQHELVSQPPTTDRVGRWRTEMAPADRATFEERAGDLLAELGYPSESDAPGAERVGAS